MEIPPGVGWISHHLPQTGWMEIQPSLSQSQAWNIKKFYDPTMQSSQMGVYLGVPNLLNNFLRIFKLWNWKLIAINPYFYDESESVLFTPI